MLTVTAPDLIATAPLGALISFTDGAPMPPARFTKKLAAWKNSNGEGTLVEVCPDRDCFTLHMQDLGGGQVIIARIYRTYLSTSSLTFAVKRPPIPGTVLCANVFQGRRKIDKVTDRAGAYAWLANNSFGELLSVGDDGQFNLLASGGNASLAA